MSTIPPGTGEEPFRLMLQGLLADRFQMAVRHETRQIAVYAITVGKDASKLKAAADDGTATRFGPGETGRQLKGNLTLTQVANLVSTTTDRPVVDLTGLPGKFEIDLNWVPDESDQTASRLSAEAAASGARKAGAPGTQDDIGPTLARVLQDKLGLKLDSRKNPTEVIVVERAEKVPKAN